MIRLLFRRLLTCSRQHFEPAKRFHQRKILPADPSHADHLPVYKYPVKSSSDINVYGWGFGQYGALGHYYQKRSKMKSKTDPRFRNYRRPLRMAIGERHKVTHIAAGYGFTAFAVMTDTQRKIYGTGLNTDSQIGYHEARANHNLDLIMAPSPIHLGLKHPTKTKVTAMSAGRAHLVVVTDLEGVFTLGNNSYGQCGRRIVNDEKYSGSRIVHNLRHFKDDKVVAVECGQDHTLLLTESGKVYACGWGADGQTGLGHYDNESRPTRVMGDIADEKIVKVSSKCDCVLAINDKGDVFGWGNSEYSQLFDRSDSEQQVNRPIHIPKCRGYGKIVDVAAAGSFCMMLNEAGEVFTWGYGILGRGPEVDQSWKPEMIPPILFGRNDFRPNSVVTSIYCGLNYSAAINDQGEVYTWGKNKSFCLGLMTDGDQFFPLRVSIGARARKLSLGVDHTIAMCNPF